MKRVYDPDKAGFVEYSEDGKIQRIKKYYGDPRYYRVGQTNPKTGEKEWFRVENAIQSWNSEK